MLLLWAALCKSAFAQAVLYTESFNTPSMPGWTITSGSLQVSGGMGYTASGVFRMNTHRTDFRNVELSVKVRNEGFTASGAGWYGAHIFLRRQSEYHTYYVSFNRSDNNVIIKKKVPGGSSNGGTYYNLTSNIPFKVPMNAWQQVNASAITNKDGSVTVRLFVNGKLIASGVDKGVGGKPITNGGSVGLRGDYDKLRFDDLVVMNADAQANGDPNSPYSPFSPAGPALDGRAPQKFITPALADGTNDTAVFGADAAEVSIYDTRGREVFRSTLAPIRWNGRDQAGNIVESGAYIAKVRHTDDSELHQTLVVAK